MRFRPPPRGGWLRPRSRCRSASFALRSIRACSSCPAPWACPAQSVHHAHGSGDDDRDLDQGRSPGNELFRGILGPLGLVLAPRPIVFLELGGSVNGHRAVKRPVRAVVLPAPKTQGAHKQRRPRHSHRRGSPVEAHQEEPRPLASHRGNRVRPGEPPIPPGSPGGQRLRSVPSLERENGASRAQGPLKVSGRQELPGLSGLVRRSKGPAHELPGHLEHFATARTVAVSAQDAPDVLTLDDANRVRVVHLRRLLQLHTPAPPRSAGAIAHTAPVPPRPICAWGMFRGPSISTESAPLFAWFFAYRSHYARTLLAVTVPSWSTSQTAHSDPA